MSGIHGADSSAESEAANRTSFEELSSELLASSFVSGTQMAKVLAENRRLRQELEETKKELENAKRELQDKELVKKMIDEDAEMHTRYWLPDEHQRFLVGLQKYGHKDMKSIAEYVGTRSTVQVRTHAQKYFLKLERHGKSLGDLGLPEPPVKEGEEEQSSPKEPAPKSARTHSQISPHKLVHTASPQGHKLDQLHHAASHPVPSVHQPTQPPLSQAVSAAAAASSADFSAFSRVPPDMNTAIAGNPGPGPSSANTAMLNHNYMLGQGFAGDMAGPPSQPGSMVPGLDVSRGGLMFGQNFSQGSGGQSFTQGGHSFNPGAQNFHQGSGQPSESMPMGSAPTAPPSGVMPWNVNPRNIVPNQAAIQLSQAWQTNVRQMMPAAAQAFPVQQHMSQAPVQTPNPPPSGSQGQADHLSYLQQM
mmetsp:Transcript_47265/g.94745  ORF Transcript_47265/g.94745 Transcript_47265/m.94745 type:complete len:419 (+) Transcript_47265:70-1326(+)